MDPVTVKVGQAQRFDGAVCPAITVQLRSEHGTSETTVLITVEMAKAVGEGLLRVAAAGAVILPQRGNGQVTP